MRIGDVTGGEEVSIGAVSWPSDEIMKPSFSTRDEIPRTF
jgi:hypothetical protein